MAQLTHLEEKLAEVTGLAMAAKAAGSKISKLTEKQDASLVATLQKMAEGGRRDGKALRESGRRFRGQEDSDS
jgi:hypothetical protein